MYHKGILVWNRIYLQSEFGWRGNNEMITAVLWKTCRINEQNKTEQIKKVSDGTTIKKQGNF